MVWFDGTKSDKCHECFVCVCVLVNVFNQFGYFHESFRYIIVEHKEVTILSTVHWIQYMANNSRDKIW